MVSASSELGLDGNIEIETINGDRPIELEQLPVKVAPATQMTQTCGVGNNQFAISGRDGLPENPSQNLRGQFGQLWQDLRLPAIRTNYNPSQHIGK